MKAKIVAISSLMFVLVFTAGCGLIPGSGNSSTPPSTPVGPINSNYSNAISPAQQLILGTMNLQGNLEVTPDEATQLLPYWEAYQDSDLRVIRPLRWNYKPRWWVLNKL